MTFLGESLLEQIHGRAAGYDRDNAFFAEDLQDLRAAGYLAAHVPTSFGGTGLSLSELAREQSRLAAAAPATALAVNMHQVWCAVARILHDRGDHGLDDLLREAVTGELFAFGISERDNDLVLFSSGTRAEPDGEDGYRFHGTKIFTSLAPAWTRLGVHGLDDSDPDDPRIVYGFVTREGTRTLEDWDTLGMRATQSRTTVLDGAHAPADRVVRRLPAGPQPDLFVLAIFAGFEILVSSVYLGIAQRALDLAVDAVQHRTSRRTGAVRAHDPDVRWRLADAAIALDGVLTQLHALAADVEAGRDHGDLWFAKLSGLKVRATDTAKDVVEAAVRVGGGASYAASHELSRLYRDVLAGLFHPSDDSSAHRTVATAILGPLP